MIPAFPVPAPRAAPRPEAASGGDRGPAPARESGRDREPPAFQRALAAASGPEESSRLRDTSEPVEPTLPEPETAIDQTPAASPVSEAPGLPTSIEEPGAVDLAAVLAAMQELLRGSTEGAPTTEVPLAEVDHVAKSVLFEVVGSIPGGLPGPKVPVVPQDFLGMTLPEAQDAPSIDVDDPAPDPLLAWWQSQGATSAEPDLTQPGPLPVAEAPEILPPSSLPKPPVMAGPVAEAPPLEESESGSAVPADEAPPLPVPAVPVAATPPPTPRAQALEAVVKDGESAPMPTTPVAPSPTTPVTGPVREVATAAPRPAPEPGLDAVPSPVDRMIAHQVLRAARDRGPDRHLVIRLTPPELGTVRIEFRADAQGGLAISLQAEDQAVRRALEQSLPHLRAELTRQDGTVTSLAVGDARASADAQRQFGESPNQDAERRAAALAGSRNRARRGDPAFSLGGESLPTNASAVQPRTVGLGLPQVNAQA